jgi:threonylcarbamoyladenosine tRNA methylthiotransferase MtaB
MPSSAFVPASKMPLPNSPGRYLVACLGCKVNQAELSWLRTELEKKGFQEAAEGQSPDLALLMTCAVTAPAARQSRQAARRLRQSHPGTRVIATGCSVQAEPEAYESIGCTVLGRSNLIDLPKMAAGELAWPSHAEPGPPDLGGFCPGMSRIRPGRSRAQLKVQDGCDAFCAYCIVPHTRGRPRSLPLSHAVEGLRDLAGAPEVVLTGIHLGMYGKDLPAGIGLVDLIHALLDAHPGPRIRLSSLEVNEVTDDLLELMASEPRLCQHLHIPLQSGSDAVLSAMGRPYTRAEFMERVNAAAGLMPRAALGADVLVGLPGEDETAFQDTYSLINELPLNFLHVFPYSPRPGTPAAEMKNRPQGLVVKQRSALLRKLGADKRRLFHEAQAGGTLSVIVENGGLARSGNYCLVELNQALPPGSLVKAAITGFKQHKKQPILIGRVI